MMKIVKFRKLIVYDILLYINFSADFIGYRDSSRAICSHRAVSLDGVYEEDYRDNKTEALKACLKNKACAGVVQDTKNGGFALCGKLINIGSTESYPKGSFPISIYSWRTNTRILS